MNFQFLSFLPILASLILTAPVVESASAAQEIPGLISQWEDTFPSPVAVIQLPKGLSDDSIFNLIDNYEINCASFPCEASDLSFTLLTEKGDFGTYEFRLSMQASEDSLHTAADSLSSAMIQMAEDVRRTAPSDLPQDLLYTAFQKYPAMLPTITPLPPFPVPAEWRNPCTLTVLPMAPWLPKIPSAPAIPEH